MVIQNLILVMSLSGSVVVGLYLITYPLAARYFPLRWRYLVLKLALVFYLVPFPYFTCRSDFFYWLRDLSPLIRKIYPRNPDESLSAVKQIFKVSITIGSSGQFLMSRKMKQMLLIVALLLLIAFITVSWYLIRYQKARRQFLKETDDVEPDQRDLFHNIKKKVGVRQNVRLVSSKFCRAPMVIGIFRPVVVLPTKEGPSDPSDEYMIKHELLHIRNRDLLVKLLGFAALALHWFNPLCYILYHELMNMGELCCDRDVLWGKGENARKEYGMLLLKLATEKESVNPPQFFSGLLHGIGGRGMKRRLVEMKRMRGKHVFLSGLIMVCIGTAGILTGFTYERPMIIKETGDEMQAQEQGHFSSKTIKALREDYWVELSLDWFVPSEYDWIDKDGKIHPVDDENQTMKLCDHKFSSDGELQRRGEENILPLGDQRYEALRCSECGYIQRGEGRIYIPSDNYWMGEDGTVIRENDTALRPEPCSHTDVSHGKLYEHQRNEEGGCVTVVREGTRCSACGQIEMIKGSQYECDYIRCTHRYKTQDYNTP